jgi:hypothetical protein
VIDRPSSASNFGRSTRTIAWLESYLHMADFGTCAIDWPLMDQWERELVDGKMPE